MSPSEVNLPALVNRLLAGHEDAAGELVRRYAGPLRLVIRHHLDARLRPALDSVDLSQDVWASFFGRELYRDGLDDPDKLFEFLCSIARNKARTAFRDQTRQKRNRTLEVPLDVGCLCEVLVSREPAPDAVVEREEARQHALTRFPAHYRTAIEMFRQRHTISEIAEHLALTPRSVRRILAEVCKRCAECE